MENANASARKVFKASFCENHNWIVTADTSTVGGPHNIARLWDQFRKTEEIHFIMIRHSFKNSEDGVFVLASP